MRPNIFHKGNEMLFRYSIRFALLLALVTPFAAYAAPLGMKTGAWNRTSSVTLGPDKKPGPTSRRIFCVKDATPPEQIVSDTWENTRCKKNILRQTASLMELEYSCPSTHQKSRIEVTSAENATVVIDTKLVNGKPFAHFDQKLRWVGTSCSK